MCCARACCERMPFPHSSLVRAAPIQSRFSPTFDANMCSRCRGSAWAFSSQSAQALFTISRKRSGESKKVGGPQENFAYAQSLCHMPAGVRTHVKQSCAGVSVRRLGSEPVLFPW